MHPATRTLPVYVHWNGHQAYPSVDSTNCDEGLQDTFYNIQKLLGSEILSKGLTLVDDPVSDIVRKTECEDVLDATT